MLIVQRPALYSTVQDEGRAALASWGISPGGVADRSACWLGNRILGNAPFAPVLELVQPPARLWLAEARLLLFAGADADIRVGEQRLPLYAPCWLPAGSHIDIARPRQGSTLLVCVAGGFMTPQVLGSASTDLRLGMSLLQAGAVLHSPPPSWQPPQVQTVQIARRYPHGQVLTQLYSPELDVLPGPDWPLLAAPAQQTLLTQVFTVSSQSNRMGVRLLGEPVAVPEQSCLSAGVCAGAIQLPPQGLPIILAAEHQPTGGYPLVLVVCAYHVSRVAQLAAGEQVRLRWQEPEQAAQRLARWQAQWRYLARQKLHAWY